jgi:hypothetical protein
MEESMKPSLKTVLVLGILMLAAGCAKNPMESADQTLTDQETGSQAYEQVLALDAEATAIEEEALADTLPGNIRKHFARALIRVEKMLDHVRVIVKASRSAEAESLYIEARGSQRDAVEAAKQDSFALAFSDLKEARFLGKQAAKVARQEGDWPTREEAIAWLEVQIDTVRGMLAQIDLYLEGHDAPRVSKLNTWARQHFGQAEKAFIDGRLIHAAFHILESKENCRRALAIIEAG